VVPLLTTYDGFSTTCWWSDVTKKSEGAAKEETRCDQVNKVLMDFFSPGFPLVVWILVLNFLFLACLRSNMSKQNEEAARSV
jgi:hypothetical protein